MEQFRPVTLVRGVVYGDVDTESIKDQILENLSADGVAEVNDFLSKKMYEASNHNVSIEDAKIYLDTMNTIASLTDYNYETNETNNLIIPKKSVSKGILVELEKVDLGKNLLDEYANDFFISHGAVPKVNAEDFCNEEEEVLETVDQDILDAIRSGKPIVIAATENTTVDEFKSDFAHIIKEIEKAIKYA